MKGKERIENEAARLLAPVLDAHGVRLWDCEYTKEGRDWYLRLTIDKDGGVTIDDCEAVSRDANEILDKSDLIQDAYTFEVSSPGLTRVLRRPKDFENSIGRKVDVKLYEAKNGLKEFTAVLDGSDGNNVTLGLDDGSKLTVAKKDLALIRLTFVG
ncbi:MAG: ribosome maturation factor RimP [Lachnospiraceae bacterium]